MAAISHLGFVRIWDHPRIVLGGGVFITVQNLIRIAAVISIISLRIFCAIGLRTPIHAVKLGAIMWRLWKFYSVSFIHVYKNYFIGRPATRGLRPLIMRGIGCALTWTTSGNKNRRTHRARGADAVNVVSSLLFEGRYYCYFISQEKITRYANMYSLPFYHLSDVYSGNNVISKLLTVTVRKRVKSA